MAIWPGMEERAIAHEDDLLVGDERVDAAAGAAAQAHAAVVVHELLGRGEHEHGVAAGVAVGDQIHRAHAVVLGHVFRVGEVLAQFQQRGRAVAMRAAGAERRRAADDAACRDTSSLGLLAWRRRSISRRSRPLRRCGSISAVAWISGISFWASTEKFNPRVSGMPSHAAGEHSCRNSRPETAPPRSCGNTWKARRGYSSPGSFAAPR